MVFIDNKYTATYYRIIDKARNRILPNDIYSEDHHIIPECFYKHRVREGPIGWLEGNPNDPSNFSRLTAREHFVCHQLLIKMVEGHAKYKMLEAFTYFSNNAKRNLRFNSRHYAMLKEANAVASSHRNKGNKHYLKRQPANDQLRQLRAKKATDSKWINDGRQEKFCSNHEYWVEKFQFVYGRLPDSINKLTKNTWTDTRRKNWSDQLKARTRYQCIHCMKSCDVGNFKRWHGDRCAKKGPEGPLIEAN